MIDLFKNRGIKVRHNYLEKVIEAEYIAFENKLSEENKKLSDKKKINMFLKRRRARVKKLANFKRSSAAKASWRKNRSKYKAGIKKFHKSTAGKKFHRQLSRFITNRLRRESLESALETTFRVEETDKLDLIVSLNTLKTNLLIESSYEDMDNINAEFLILLEHYIPVIDRIIKFIQEDINIPIGILEDISVIIPREDIVKSCHYLEGVNDSTKLDNDIEMCENLDTLEIYNKLVQD